MAATSKDIYFREIKGSMPRILNLLNRNPSSENYGSFDRDFWNYNSFDISNARKQEAALALTLMYSIKRKDNPYHNNKAMLEWINASLYYTKKLQNKDGSFNEMYPNEHSFVATAFVSYSISETLLLLRDRIKNRDSIVRCLKKSGDWLLKNNENMAHNQKAGSVIALYNIYLLTRNPIYRKGANDKLRGMLKRQSAEGWFQEYDGADIGYLSLSIDYLAKYYKKTKDSKLLQSIRKAVDFIVYFMSPDYSVSGEIGSRNTTYLIPHGFEILSGKIDNAKTICNYIRNAISLGKAISPATVDDRYLLFNSYAYLQAYVDGTDYKRCNNWPPKKDFLKYFKEAGIVIRNAKNAYSIININKGAVLKIVFGKSSLNDGGAAIILSNGEMLSSSYIGRNEKINIEEKIIEAKRKFSKVRATSLSPYSFLAFRTFQLTIGKSGIVSRKVRDFIRNRIIRQKYSKTEAEFSRNIEFKNNGIRIIDEIKPLDGISSIIISSNLSFIFAESSRFFQASDLDSAPFIISGKALSELGKKGKIRLTREYDNSGKLVSSKLS